MYGSILVERQKSSQELNTGASFLGGLCSGVGFCAVLAVVAKRVGRGMAPQMLPLPVFMPVRVNASCTRLTGGMLHKSA